MYRRFGISLVILSCCAGQELDSDDLIDDDSRGSGSRELYNSTKNRPERISITQRVSLVDDLDEAELTDGFRRTRFDLIPSSVILVAPTPPSGKRTTKHSSPISQPPYWVPYPGSTEPPNQSEFLTVDTPERPEIDTNIDTEIEPLIDLEETLDPTDSYNITSDLGITEGQPQDLQTKASSTQDESFTYPFAVSVLRMGSHYASGALVDHRWVLTVAEEFFNVRESIKIYRMRLGSVDCKKGGSLIPLKRIEIHPSFVVGKPSYDVALIQLGVPVADMSDAIKPIAFAEEKEKMTKVKLLSIYWPRLVLKGEVLPYTAKEREKSHSMRVSSQRVVPWDKCYRVMDFLKVTLSESTLCLKPLSSHHSGCLPDVGAPVVGDEGLWGITSGWVSPNCKQVSSPVMVTRITAPLVLNWLDTTMAAY